MRLVSLPVQSWRLSTLVLHTLVWTLCLCLALTSTKANEDEYDPFAAAPPASPLVDLMDDALSAMESAERDPSRGFDSDAAALGRFRKAGNSRPKYDPGLKWMGLGKRPAPPADQPLGPQVFPDLRQFFLTASDRLIQQYKAGSPEEAPPAAASGISRGPHRSDTSGEGLKFVLRSKQSAAVAPAASRKGSNNPSLYWTGLGR